MIGIQGSPAVFDEVWNTVVIGIQIEVIEDTITIAIEAAFDTVWNSVVVCVCIQSIGNAVAVSIVLTQVSGGVADGCAGAFTKLGCIALTA